MIICRCRCTMCFLLLPPVHVHLQHRASLRGSHPRLIRVPCRSANQIPVFSIETNLSSNQEWVSRWSRWCPTTSWPGPRWGRSPTETFPWQCSGWPSSCGPSAWWRAPTAPCSAPGWSWPGSTSGFIKWVWCCCDDLPSDRDLNGNPVQVHSNGAKGDQADSFAFATLFPNVLQVRARGTGLI